MRSSLPIWNVLFFLVEWKWKGIEWEWNKEKWEKEREDKYERENWERRDEEKKTWSKATIQKDGHKMDFSRDLFQPNRGSEV